MSRSICEHEVAIELHGVDEDGSVVALVEDQPLEQAVDGQAQAERGIDAEEASDEVVERGLHELTNVVVGVLVLNE